jgi:signal transduction histidine kinase
VEAGRALWIAGAAQMAVEGEAALRAIGVRGLGIAPIPLGGELWGGIVLLARDALRIAEAQLRLLMAIAAQIGRAAEDAELRDLAAQIQVREGLIAAQTRIIADVTHDFRSPLGLIRSAGESLAADAVAFAPGAREEMLGILIQETEYLESLVENLLNLSQVGRGEMMLHRRETDLVALARSVTRRAELHAERHHIALDVADDALWADVDPRALSRVFTNLLSNAVKYSPPGSAVTVRMRAARDQAIVSVADEGIGIAAEHVDRIFERFYRVPGEATARARGVGLGLPVCKAMVEAHGGQIWVESAPGEGSLFTFSLPRGASERGGAW